MTIDLVFFDVGDTLVRPHPSFHELFSERCILKGRMVEPAAVEQMQMGIAPHLVELAEETGISAPSLSAADSRTFWTHLYHRLLAELGIEDEGLVEDLYATFSSSASYRLFDDALPALEALRSAGYRLGVISNFEGWLAEMLIELEVGHLFDVTVISGVEGMEKPDPRIFELALERAGIEAGAAAHVGDSPTMDLEPAEAAGMKAILIDRRGRYPDRGPRISTLSELPAALS